MGKEGEDVWEKKLELEYSLYEGCKLGRESLFTEHRRWLIAVRIADVVITIFIVTFRHLFMQELCMTSQAVCSE